MSEIDDLIDTPNPGVSGFGIKHGLILGLISIVLSYSSYATGQIENKALGYAVFLLLAVLVYFFQKKYRDTLHGGRISFGKAFKLGFVIYFFAILLGVFYNLWFWNAHPETIDIMLEAQYNEFVSNGKSPSEIDQSMDFLERIWTPKGLSLLTFVIGLFFGLLFSLITSAIVKSN